MSQKACLWEGFLSSAKRFPNRPAILAAGRQSSYAELREAACRIAATLQAHSEFGNPALTGIFAHRTTTAFEGVLGALLAGSGYVPLNRTFPAERTHEMFARSGVTSLVVDLQSLPQLSPLLDRATSRVLVIVPELDDVASLRVKWAHHAFAGSQDLAPATAWREPEPNTDKIAYLLFTSGSTGIPKGVMVTVRNVLSFVDYMVDRYGITEEDRFSQMFDLTFDLSAFDMFVCWERGACLCCPSQKVLMSPGKFIRDNQLTIWFSVPSTVAFMKQLGLLKPARYPSLRLSLFCGEPLPISAVTAWLDAAPNSIVENLYGPTELTIACTLYPWDPVRSPQEAEMGIVPIGYPYPGMNVLIANEELAEVEPGKEGELLMNGPQMSPGYWKDPDKTAAAFVIPRGKNTLYYRTGDRVRRPMDGGPMTHLGRIDFQVKVLGHRVELGEVESKVRTASGLDGVVAVGWPQNESGYGGIEVFLEGNSVDKEQLRNELVVRLPDYMVPRRFHVLDNLPRNANGKYDRGAMVKMLEGGL